MILYKNY